MTLREKSQSQLKKKYMQIRNLFPAKYVSVSCKYGKTIQQINWGEPSVNWGKVWNLGHLYFSKAKGGQELRQRWSGELLEFIWGAVNTVVL